jgi:molybdenum cofactor cytidylyltransferase
MTHAPDLVVAVLAAGASRRLGRAKQLVRFGGEPLVRRQCRCAVASDVGHVVAILGCDAERHRAAIEDLPVAICVNREWAEGLAATLRCAVDAAGARRAALLVLPCDQYRITAADLRALCSAWRNAPSQPCVSRADSYAGPPAILPLEHHDRVRGLRGDTGARSLLYQSARRPTEVVNPRALFDLDCPEDLRVATAWQAKPL